VLKEVPAGRPAGFSKDSVSELFNLLQRTVERVRQCFNNILEGTGVGGAMEECNFAYLVSLKCEESSHYNSHFLLCQRCWLLCTSYGECTVARTCLDVKRGAEFCTVALNALRSLLEIAACHPSGSSNCEMAVRLSEVPCPPAARNAHYTRRLKFWNFSVFVIFIIMKINP
jgi:hypothetical protein